MSETNACIDVQVQIIDYQGYVPFSAGEPFQRANRQRGSIWTQIWKRDLSAHSLFTAAALQAAGKKVHISQFKKQKSKGRDAKTETKRYKTKLKACKANIMAMEAMWISGLWYSVLY